MSDRKELALIVDPHAVPVSHGDRLVDGKVENGAVEHLDDRVLGVDGEIALEELLQTTAEIAAAFAGFASVVVIFRRRGDVRTDSDTRVTFQSMLLGSLFVVFFGLLPLVLAHALGSPSSAFFYSAALLLVYIVGTFIWGLMHAGGSKASVVPYLIAACIITISQVVGLSGLMPAQSMYLVGVFTLLTISGYAFFSLIALPGANEEGI